MSKFKIHMVFHADMVGFTTMCGISEDCSEAFYDGPNNLVEFGNVERVTCKRCISKYKKHLIQEQKRLDYQRVYDTIVESYLNDIN